MKDVWYVQGDPETAGVWPSRVWPNLFETKEAAEVYARMMFPDEDESKRYARIFFREVLTMSDLRGG